MNNKTTVTVEEFFKKNIPEYLRCDLSFKDRNIIREAMIEFAKIKCREMQESILEKAFVSPIEGAYYEQEVNKESILNAYDIEGIK